MPLHFLLLPICTLPSTKLVLLNDFEPKFLIARLPLHRSFNERLQLQRICAFQAPFQDERGYTFPTAVWVREEDVEDCIWRIRTGVWVVLNTRIERLEPTVDQKGKKKKTKKHPNQNNP